MSTDILALADRLWRGEVHISEYHPVTHLGGLAEITDDVAFLPAFANVTAIRTSDGLVLVDTGSAFVAQAIHDELRRWTTQRLHTAVYSHGHIDHVFGVGVWEAEAAEKGWPAPVVIAHEALPRRFDRYRMTVGYNEIINQRQFGIRGCAGRPIPLPGPYLRRASSPSRWAARRSSCGTRRARPTTTQSPGFLTTRCCAAATCSSGRRRTPGTRRRCSGTRWNGRLRCAG